MVGNFGRETLKLDGSVDTDSINHHVTWPHSEKGYSNSADVVWAESEAGREAKMTFKGLMEPFGQMECNAVTASIGKFVVDLFWMPALFRPIHASGDSPIQTATCRAMIVGYIDHAPRFLPGLPAQTIIESHEEKCESQFI